MNKLYFKYGAMGSAKSANALMCKFNYEQKGFKVLLIKPSMDTRDLNENKKIVVKSRIGLQSECITFSNSDNIIDIYKQEKPDVIIMDECNMATPEHINQCKEISTHIPVLCYGLLTNFKTELFPASKRLVELAESLTEIKSVCKCGKKATINARFCNDEICTDGEEFVIGGDEGLVRYEGLCYSCYKKLVDEKNKKELEN